MNSLTIGETGLPSATSSIAKIRTMSPLASRLAWAALIVLQVAHLVLRDSAWVMDVRWASSQYLFSIILFGPVLSGIAAEQGRQAAKSNWIVRSSPVKGTLSWLSYPLQIGLTVFLSGWLSVILVAFANGAIWALTFATLLNLLSATIGVVTFTLVGFAFGTMWGHRLVAAVAVLLTFAVMIVGWTGSFSSLVWFGGAPGGVAGTEQSTAATIFRISFNILIITIAASIAVRPAGRSVSPIGGATLVIAMLVVGMLATLTQPTQRQPIAWKCELGALEVCVPAQYERLLPTFSSWIASSQVVDALSSASENASSVLEIQDELLLAEVNKFGIESVEAKERLSTTVTRLFAPNCFPIDESPSLSEEQSEAFGLLTSWVDHEVMGKQLLLERYGITDIEMLGVPDLPIGTQEVTRFLNENLEILPSCPR